MAYHRHMATSDATVAGIDHINIDTAKPDETIDFYQRILGLENRPEDRPNFDFAGAWLFSGQQAVIHLNFHDEASKTGQRLAGGGRSGAFNHIAFAGSDFDGFCARLDQLDIDYRTATVRAGLRQIFLRDPNDVAIEINIAE